MLANASSTTSPSSASLPYCTNVCSFILSCLNYTTAALVVTILSITSILLLLPLLIFAFCDVLRQQQRRRTRRTSSSSHLFTYHLMAFELLSILGSVACLCGSVTDYKPLKIVWLYALAFTAPGQTLLHLLSCLERYVAVLHPIIFRRLKEAKMITMRNVVIAFIWLLCSSQIGLLRLTNWIPTVFMQCSLWFTFSLSSFFSISALCALIRPRLSRKAGDREQTGRPKLMASYAIMVHLGGLWLRFLGQMFILFVFLSVHMGMAEQCMMAMSGLWFGIPNSLMLPLLVVHRTRKG